MSNKRNCENCQFWKREKNIIFGLCNNDNLSYIEDMVDPTKDDVLLYWDSELYGAGFKTGRKFRCIHFKILPK